MTLWPICPRKGPGLRREGAATRNSKPGSAPLRDPTAGPCWPRGGRVGSCAPASRSVLSGPGPLPWSSWRFPWPELPQWVFCPKMLSPRRAGSFLPPKLLGAGDRRPLSERASGSPERAEAGAAAAWWLLGVEPRRGRTASQPGLGDTSRRRRVQMGGGRCTASDFTPGGTGMAALSQRNRPWAEPSLRGHGRSGPVPESSASVVSPSSGQTPREPVVPGRVGSGGRGQR